MIHTNNSVHKTLRKHEQKTYKFWSNFLLKINYKIKSKQKWEKNLFKNKRWKEIKKKFNKKK